MSLSVEEKAKRRERYKQRSPEQKAKERAQDKRYRERVKADPVLLARRREREKQYRESIRANDPVRWDVFQAKGRERANARYQRVKDDPEWKAAHHKRTKRVVARIKADPVRYGEHLVAHRRYSRQLRERQKAQLREMYGASCVLCGADHPKVLSLDHVNGGGGHERKRIGPNGVYRRALEVYRPDEYRTLCMNCQFIERADWE